MNTTKFGVPCSKIKTRIEDADVPCTSESEAMALAVGAWFAGKKPEVYMQNSGLGNIVDIVTSLYHPYNIPLPHMLLSVRQYPFHHQYMFYITKKLLHLLGYFDVEKVIQDE